MTNRSLLTNICEPREASNRYQQHLRVLTCEHKADLAKVTGLLQKYTYAMVDRHINPVSPGGGLKLVRKKYS